MATTTLNFGLIFWQEGDTQPHTKVNDMMTKFDFWVGREVISMTTDAQPGSPSEGDAYIMTAGRTGAAWSTFQTNSIAYYLDGAWIEYTAVARPLVYVNDQNNVFQWNGTTWINPFEDGSYLQAADIDTFAELNAIVADVELATEAYVDAEIATAVAGLLDFKGGYDASTNTPDLDVSPSGVEKGDTYVVTAAGDFFTEPVQNNDTIYARIDNPTVLGDWVVVQANDDLAASVRVVSGTTDTLLSTDVGKIVIYTNASNIAVTLPDTFAVGWQCSVVQAGAGIPTVTRSGTDTINGGTSVAVAAQWEGKYLVQYQANTWLGMG